MSNPGDYYAKNLWQLAGDTGADHTKMEAPYQHGVLHLVYWQNYTLEGRQYFHAWVPGNPWPAGAIQPPGAGPALTDADVRAELKRKFGQEYNINGAAQEALIGAHFAGWAWVVANDAGNIPQRNLHEATFKQNMAAVAWALWEEGTGPLFPLPW